MRDYGDKGSVVERGWAGNKAIFHQAAKQGASWTLPRGFKHVACVAALDKPTLRGGGPAQLLAESWIFMSDQPPASQDWLRLLLTLICGAVRFYSYFFQPCIFSTLDSSSSTYCFISLINFPSSK